MKIKIKYNIGDEVWFITNEPCKVKITGVVFESREDFRKDYIAYYVCRPEYAFPILLNEFQLFPTKEELLKSL